MNKGTRRTITKSKDWNGIWDILQLDKEKRENLINIQKDLLEHDKNLKRWTRELLNTKDNLLEEVNKISIIVNDRALHAFSSKKTLKTILWINEV